MKNQIIIHAKGDQTRIALIENGELAQFFVESPEVTRTVGDIYVARVHKVMAGIRAAFIDMGTPKDAFLHFSDVGEHLVDYIEMLNGKDALKHVDNKILDDLRADSSGKKGNDNLSGFEKQNRAASMLRPDQKLLVQIVKEPMGSKGPRVSTDISLAGRFVVLIPMGNYTAVSKRIRSHRERRRLRGIVNSEVPKGFGVIVRTVAGGQPDEIIKEDLHRLLKKWNDALESIKTAKPPTLLYRDLDMTESLIRDLFAKDYDRVLIDDPMMYRSIKNYVAQVAPRLLPNIQPYKGREHIFDYMKISQDVDSIFTPRVRMRSGGYLIFEQTEAMYVIDVNSGRYAAKKNQEENSLKTNLEAARELAKQLRLRDIGGIIVVDFIDLRDDGNRKKVFDELRKEFRKDQAKTNILPMSDFGLVQITRQRIRPSVTTSVSKVCPMCGGSGTIVSQNTILTDLEAWLTKFTHLYRYRAIDLYVNPYLRSYLTRGMLSYRLKWALRYRIRINIMVDETISMNDFKFTLPGSDVDITEAVLTDQPIEVAIKQSEELLSNTESSSKKDISKLDMFDDDEADNPDDSAWDDIDEDQFDKVAKASQSRSRSRRSNGGNRSGGNRGGRPNNRGRNPQSNRQNSNDDHTESKPNESSDQNSGSGKRNVSNKYYKRPSKQQSDDKNEQAQPEKEES